MVYQAYSLASRRKTTALASLMDPSLSRLLKGHLTSWDRGNKHVRHIILQKFVSHFASATEPELEREFANGASLFLVRVCAYTRFCAAEAKPDIILPLKVVSVFVKAACGRRYIKVSRFPKHNKLVFNNILIRSVLKCLAFQTSSRF
jgi:hypothetical protein